MVYALSIEELNSKLSRLLNFSDDFQIDIMDGAYVPEESFDITELKELPAGKLFEFHLMVAHPLEYMSQLKRLGVRKVIFHDEIDEDTATDIEAFKNEGFVVFLAINPESPVEQIEGYIPMLDGVMLMSVHPGKTGQQFISEVLDKARELRKKYPELVLEIDGGVNKDNIISIFEAGINIVGIGSGILKAEDPEKAWEEFKKIASIL